MLFLCRSSLTRGIKKAWFGIEGPMTFYICGVKESSFFEISTHDELIFVIFPVLAARQNIIYIVMLSFLLDSDFEYKCQYISLSFLDQCFLKIIHILFFCFWISILLSALCAKLANDFFYIISKIHCQWPKIYFF